MKVVTTLLDVLAVEHGKGTTVMSAEMEYKGQFGSCEYSEADRVYYGKLKYIRDLVLYESDEADGLKAAFEEAVDDYLSMCEAEGIEPN